MRGGSPPLLRRLLRRWMLRMQSRQAHSSLSGIPRFPEASYRALEKARRRLAEDDLPAAEAAVRAGLEHDLGNADAHLMLGELLLGRELPAALNAFDQALRFSTDRRATLYRITSALIRHRQIRWAHKYIGHLLTLDPRDPEALRVRADLGLD